jgi:hypothetical protein
VLAGRGQWGGEGWQGGEGSKNGAVGFEQGTSKDGDLLPCIKADIPSKGFFIQ